MIGVDFEALGSWMSRSGLGEGPITDVRELAGGTQNILVAFRRSGRSYVLRRPPVHLRANSNAAMLREAQMLAALAGTAVPHPGLIASCGDDSILGAAFYLMEPVTGFNAVNGLPPLHASDPALRRRMGLAMVEAIAELGALDYQALGLADFGKVDNFLERQVARWRSQLDSYAELAGWPGPSSIPGLEDVAAWLEAERPASFTPGIIHGDFHIANVMFRPESAELAAVVDWELTTIGAPLLDLGWMLATWPESQDDTEVRPWADFATPRDLIAHYAERSPHDLSQIGWYAVLACYKLGIILEGTYARACAGKAPRETGDRLHAKTLKLFDRARRLIESDMMETI